MKKVLVTFALMLTTSIAFATNLDVPIKAHPAAGLVLEVVIFQSKPGVSSQQLLTAAEKMNPVLTSMPGFISRSVGHGQGNQWVDVVYWQTMSDALRAAQRITAAPAMQDFESLMISQTVQMYHFTIKNANEACYVKQRVGS